MLTVFPDWIAPLFVSTSEGTKIRPGRLDDLTALDSGWLNQPGSVIRYSASGADLVAVYKQPTAPGTVLNVKYARAPKALVNDTDMPEIRAQFHPALVDYTAYRPRQREGGLEFAKSFKYLDAFLSAAQTEAAYVRSRAIAGRYDKMPFELASFDRSKLLRLRPDLPPVRTLAA